MSGKWLGDGTFSMETVDRIDKAVEKSEENSEADMWAVVTNRLSTSLLLQTAQVLSAMWQTARTQEQDNVKDKMCSVPIPAVAWTHTTKARVPVPTPTNTHGPTKLSLNQIQKSQ